FPTIVLPFISPALAKRRPIESKAEQQRISQLSQKSQASYETIYYKSGNLNIEAYFYKPQGNGPFPLVIYNHGSRAGSERVEKPMQFISAVLVPQATPCWCLSGGVMANRMGRRPAKESARTGRF